MRAAGQTGAQRRCSGRHAVEADRSAGRKRLNNDLALHLLERNVEFKPFATANADLLFNGPVIGMIDAKPVFARQEFALELGACSQPVVVERPAGGLTRRAGRTWCTLLAS